MGLKERLKNGEKVIGTMVGSFDFHDIAIILKNAGFDYFIVDSEHGYIDNSRMAALIAVAKASDMPVVIRIPQPDREMVLKYMEMGADGLLMPNTEDAAQAKKLVEYAKYAPLGNRGVALLKAHAGYQPGDAVAYMKQSNEHTLLMCQIESPTGVENIDEIMAVDGIDAAFIGPNDLSQSMGIMGQFEHPEFQKALERVIEAAKAHGKYSGIHMGNMDSVKAWAKKGMTLNLWQSDIGLLLNSAKAGVKSYKG